MEFNIKTCLPTCVDYDPDTKTCRKLEEYPNSVKFGAPCPYDADAATYLEGIVEEALAKEGTVRGTVWDKEKQKNFKTIIDLCEKIRRLSPLVKKKIFFPTNYDEHAMVFLYLPMPAFIFNQTIKNTLAELFLTADSVFFREEKGRLKIIFDIERIWADIK